MNKLRLILPTVAVALAAASAEAAPLKVRQLFVGEQHACAILKDRRIKCWGDNQYGQLGLGDEEDRGDEADEMGNHLPYVDLGDIPTVRQLALGMGHTCALSGINTVRCWGLNEHGQLGLEDTENRGDEPGEMGTALRAIRVTEDQTITSIVAGREHTCVLIEDGSVKCWGRNQYGQLGLGNEDSFGDDWMELLPNINVELGTGRHAVQITAGAGHTCALLDDDTVKCWGLNDSGQLGIGSTFERGDSAFEMGHYLHIAEFNTNYGTPIAVAAGGTHTCVTLDRGGVICWGANADGQLGKGHTDNLADDLPEIGLPLMPVDLDFTFSPATAVVTGGFHTCALGATGVKCWGLNIVGQLGNAQGTRDSIGDDTSELGIFLDESELGAQPVIQLAAGWLTTCARFLNERIKCWGSNAEGSLGLGHEESRGVDPQYMGDALPYIDLGDDGIRETPPGPGFPR